MSFDRAEQLAMALGIWMFRPLRQLEDGRWTWECTQLQPNGRCGIYENRPQLCRDFAPGEGPLCVHYVPRDEEAGPA